MARKSEVLNLKVIADAIREHNANCMYPATQVLMCAFEVERLGWDEIAGVPIVIDGDMPTGRFKIMCDGALSGGSGKVAEEKRDQTLTPA